ncbi:hypothetical protein BDD12DRAFT_882193 [Trichophaea hybrida]|nr:hypothetical protein BDD12DRAFT_882193 [Trichophaea hybrida]
MVRLIHSLLQDAVPVGSSTPHFGKFSIINYGRVQLGRSNVLPGVRQLSGQVTRMQWTTARLSSVLAIWAITKITVPTRTHPSTTDIARTPLTMAELAQAETEPAKTEPAMTEPAKMEPVKQEPAKTEPASLEHGTMLVGSPLPLEVQAVSLVMLFTFIAWKQVTQALTSALSTYHVIIGYHGTGKSTLIRKIAGEIPGIIYVLIPPSKPVKCEEVLTAAFKNALNWQEPGISYANMMWNNIMGRQIYKPDDIPTTNWRRVFEDIEHAATKFKAKHNQNAVLVFDNINVIAEADKELLAVLHGFAKIATHLGLFIVVFVCSDGVTPFQMRNFLMYMKFEEFSRLQAVAHLNGTERANKIAATILWHGTMHQNDYWALCGDHNTGKHVLSFNMFAIRSCLQYNGVPYNVFGFENEIVEAAIRERLEEGSECSIDKARWCSGFGGT